MSDNITVQDALDVFTLPPSHALEQLKARYRHVVLGVHPDRGGSAELFNTVNECYRVLLEDFAARHAPAATHDQMRMGFEHFVDKHDAMSRRHVPGQTSSDDFDGAWFNEVFEKTRVRDDVKDQGYGDWLSNEDDLAKPKPKRALNPKCTMETFNKAFEKAVPVREESKALIVRPDPGVLGNTLAFTEIGVESLDNYEVAVGGGLVGYDCQMAHTERRIGSVYAGQTQPMTAFDSTRIERKREQDLERGLSEDEILAERRDTERQRVKDAARRGVQMRIDRNVSGATYRANMMMLSR